MLAHMQKSMQLMQEVDVNTQQQGANWASKQDAKASINPAQIQTVKRVHNFSAGPACVDTEVMMAMQKEWLDFNGSGMGFIEHSHRDAGGPVQTMMVGIQDLVKEVLRVPDSHSILLMHGGAHQQFSAVPLNLCQSMDDKVDFVDTGYWAIRAMNHAKKYCDPRICSTNRGFLQDVASWDIREDAKYVHMCMNETIAGLEYMEDPDLSTHPKFVNATHVPELVCDATSTLLSRPVDISKYGVIFASSGKNLGPSGITLVIVKNSILERSPNPFIPEMMDYREQANSKPIQNIYNTPPTFQVLATHTVLEKLKAEGGCEAMKQKCDNLSARVYDYVDASSFYQNVVDPKYRNDRSRMNVCFQIGGTKDEIGEEARQSNMALEKLFTKTAAAEHGIEQLMGHPIFGGLRVTIYNPVKAEAVEAAIKFMELFAAEHANEVEKVSVDTSYGSSCDDLRSLSGSPQVYA